MIKPRDFYNCLINNNFDFFTGVPDSLLKELCFYGLDSNEQGMFFTFGDLQDYFVEEIWKTEIENFENEIVR